MLIEKLLALISLIYSCTCFNFKQITVSPDSNTIGVTTSYGFIYERNINNTNFATPWDTQSVPAGSTITVTFPSQYTLSSITCISVTINSVSVTGYSCATSGSTVTISGAIPSNQFIDTIQTKLGNIKNPVPAVFTGQFTGTIGVDIAVANGGGVQLTPATFDSCAITFDTAYVNQSSTMVVTLDPKNALDSTATILINAPRRWTNDIVTTSQLPITSTMICVNYSSNVASSPTCAGNNVYFTITVSNLLGSSTSGSFSFGVKSMISPPTLQPSDSFTIVSYINGDQVDQCTTFVSNLLPNTFLAVAVSPLSTMTVNSNVGLKFDLTLADVCNQYDDIQVTFPSQLVPTFLNVSGSGVYNTTTSSVSGLVLNVINRRTTARNFTKGTVYGLNFNQVKAPPSTKTSGTITIKFQRNGFDKMIGYATVQAVASTLTGVVSPTVTIVNRVTTYAINVTITDPLTSAGMVKITFPSTITLTLTSTCATLVGTSVTTNPTCVYDSVANSILISNMNSSNANIGAQTLRFTILGVKNPPSINPSGTFSVITYYSTDTTAIVSQGTLSGITATMDIIDASKVTLTPSTYVVSDTFVTYTLKFQNGNNIPQNGYAEITIPSGVTLNIGSVSSYCKLSIDGGTTFFSTTCAGTSITGGYYVNFSAIAQSSARAVGTKILFRIQSLFTNPSDTSVVSTFTIKTYHSDGYAIQQLTTGISVQMTTPSTMTSMDITRTIQKNSDTTASYTFKLIQTPNLPASARLTITYPSTLTLGASTACLSLTSVTLTCTQSTGSIQIQLTSAVSSGTQFGVTLTNIINPPSFAPFSTAFTFLTRSSDRMLSYASGSLLPSMQNSIPSAFVSLSGSFSSTIYGQATNLQITLTPSSRIIPTYMLVTIPSSFTISGSLSCTSWSCSSVTSNVIRINNITSTSQIVFTVSGMNAPNSAPSDYVKVESFDSGGYKIDSNQATIIFSVTCTMPCRTCLTTNTSSCVTCYSSTTITSFIYLYQSNSQCYSTCPSNTYTDTSTRKCLNCSSNCLTCSGSSTNCLSCYSNSTFLYLFVNNSVGNCRSSCPTFYYPDTTQNPILCVLCISPCSTCTSSTQCTSCLTTWYFYNNSCVSTCPSGITISNTQLNQCDACSTQCATCFGTVDNCTGCSSTAALYNSTCVTVCPSPLVKNNGQCLSCSTTCLTCSLTYDNCTSCDTSSTLKYLYNFTCISNCPQLYYNSLVNGRCILCSTLNIGCDNCTSTSTCGTCNWVQGYVFFNNTCSLTVPNGYFNQSGYAQACDSTTKDCATCINQAFNCTACVTLNLQGNLCVSQCNAGFVGVNQVCVACTSNCKTCSNLQSNCTSCDPSLTPQVFLSNFQCTTTCPDYTYGNQSTNQCTSCISPCQKCTSRSVCTTCASGFFFYNNICDTTCPYGYLGINRICVKCTSPCQNCSSSLTTCTVCEDTYYLVTSTSNCVTNCPTGLYPNDAVGQCTGCVTPCATCSTTASTCLTCLNNLNLFNGTCIANCPDGYYLLNNQCIQCNTNCTRCTSASVCQSCIVSLYLYNNNCISSCPSTHPVTTTGQCTACTDTNCIVCDSLNQCSRCTFPYLLLSGQCLATCPANYTSNSTDCIYTPIDNNTNNTNTTNQTLNETLSSANLFPVPFTIAGSFVGIACIMSKFQHPYTFISGSLYSIWSLLQWGAVGVGAYLYYLSYKDKITFTVDYIQAFVYAAAIGFFYLLNILAFIAQSCFLKNQQAFLRWLDKQGSNNCFYGFCNVAGLFFTHKFKNILFSKLFGFDIFNAKLNSIQSFRIFNIFSFLSILSSGGILFGTSYMIYKHHVADQQLMAYIDVLVLTVACVILSILNSRKDQSFFQQKDEDGIIINKRVIQSDSIMQQAIIPFMGGQSMQQMGGNIQKPKLDSQRKIFKSYETQSISSISEQSYHYIQPPKQVHNISIQAAPVLQDYSKIDFYNDEELSDISMFKKVDKSINMTKQLHANQVSIQNDMNIFDQKDMSIQNNPQHDDISVQHQVDVRDISLQNVPNAHENGVQMSRHQEDHSIQVGVLVNNASIQYSAKPVFESISQDFIDSEGQQPLDQAQNYQSQINQKPANDPSGLKAQLQLDVDQKLRRREQEMQMQRKDQIARKKQEMLKKFHQQQQRKNILSHQKNDQFDKVNKIYNNQISREDGSSLMDSQANIMVHFKNRMNKSIREPREPQNEYKDNEQSKQQVQNAPQQKQQIIQRAQSAKTEKQFIQMLENNERNGLNLQSSLSFNVTRDLQSGNQNGRRIRNVVYQQQDKVMDSGDDNVELQQPGDKKNRQAYILQNDTNQQIPSGIDKSRSTNFLSTNGRRPPLPNRFGSKNFLDQSSNIQNSNIVEQNQQINHHPIRAIKRRIAPTSNYQEQDLNYEARTNLTNFLDRRKNNPISAHQLGNKKLQNLDSQQIYTNSKQIRQNPLPLPKIQRLKSQQSNHSNDNSERLYRMGNRKALLEDRKLEFQDDQKIDLDSEHYQSQQRLPPVSQEPKLRKIRSQTKIPERDRSYQKAVHREILGKQRFVDRTQKFLQKELKKAENTKKKIQQMQVMLQRPNINNDKGYLKETYSSQDKKKKSQLQKVYMNNPFEKKFEY